MRSVFDATTGPSSAITLVLCLVVQCCENVEYKRNVLTDGKISMQSVRVFVGEKWHRMIKQRFPFGDDPCLYRASYFCLCEFV